MPSKRPLSLLLLSSTLLVFACDEGTADADGGTEGARYPGVSDCIGDRGCTDVLFVAHRGAGMGEPENTVAAIKAAALGGADVVEVDIQPTADGVLVLMHDDDAGRVAMTHADGLDQVPIGELTLAELKSLTIDDAEGRCSPENADALWERCRIPTFREALDAAVGRTVLMIDYKSGDLATVAADINGAGAVDHVFFFDANEANLDDMMARVPGIAVMPRVQNTEEALEVMARRDPVILHADIGYLEEVKDEAKRRGIKVLVDIFGPVDYELFSYNVSGDDTHVSNAEQSLHDIIAAGAGLMQTDYVPDVREILGVE